MDKEIQLANRLKKAQQAAKTLKKDLQIAQLQKELQDWIEHTQRITRGFKSDIEILSEEYSATIRKLQRENERLGNTVEVMNRRIDELTRQNERLQPKNTTPAATVDDHFELLLDFESTPENQLGEFNV